MNDTIAAISSGFINQPISIIRLSGDDAFKIVKKIFMGPQGAHRTITFGKIVVRDQPVDEVLVSWFCQPYSYTGQNMVEINAHGGLINTQRILEALLVGGARQALPGEFSRRAFLNGKIDLIKAEAIHDLIFAKTTYQADLAFQKFDQHTSNAILDLQNQLLNVIAQIETSIDYPEYDEFGDHNFVTLVDDLEVILEQVQLIEKTSEQSRYLFEGVKVAIIGKPNVGKSSLLNLLLGEDKAIVTPIPGTTRDVVEGEIVFNQVLLKIKDTAGLRETNDLVEQMGIAKSKAQVEQSDLIIHMQAIDDYDAKENALFKDKLVIHVINKIDLQPPKMVDENMVFISIKDHQVQQLYDKLTAIFPKLEVDSKYFLSGARQRQLIKQASLALKEGIQVLRDGQSIAVAIIFVREAWTSLGNILGKVYEEDLLDAMFKNFCLGK